MLAVALPAWATTFVGASGTVAPCGVTALLGAEKALVPTELFAATVN